MTRLDRIAVWLIGPSVAVLNDRPSRLLSACFDIWSARGEVYHGALLRMEAHRRVPDVSRYDAYDLSRCHALRVALRPRQG